MDDKIDDGRLAKVQSEKLSLNVCQFYNGTCIHIMLKLERVSLNIVIVKYVQVVLPFT